METTNEIIIIEGETNTARALFLKEYENPLIVVDLMLETLLLDYKALYKSELSLYISTNIKDTTIIFDIRDKANLPVINDIKEIAKTLGINVYTKTISEVSDTPIIEIIIKKFLKNYLTEFEYYDNTIFEISSYNYDNTQDIIKVVCKCEESPTGLDEFSIPILNLIAYSANTK